MKSSLLDRKIIALTGIMGSGKTYIGKRLSEVINVEFIDSDFEIEKSENLSISDIFTHKSEKYFREIEEKKIEEIINNINKVTILSLGGGAVISPKTLDLLKNKTILIWINIDIDILVNRLINGRNRPLLQGKNITETINKILQDRMPLYKQAHLEITPNEKISKKFLYDIMAKIENLSHNGQKDDSLESSNIGNK